MTRDLLLASYPVRLWLYGYIEVEQVHRLFFVLLSCVRDKPKVELNVECQRNNIMYAEIVSAVKSTKALSELVKAAHDLF